MKYLIGTGWWCDETGIHTHTKHQPYVDKETRQQSFFDLWYKSVMSFTKPSKIVVIDSNSPVKPNLSEKKNVILYSLDNNYGAALDGTTERILSGWDRSILLSATVAFFEDCDYFVYVEQDCLLWGENIIENIIDSMGDKKIALGNGGGTPQPLQQSLVIIRKDYIPFFTNLEMTSSQEELSFSPESRYFNKFKDDIKFFDIDFGRKRPIDFNKNHFYAQHLNKEELKTFKEKLIEL
jgi:hypothetical protein